MKRIHDILVVLLGLSITLVSEEYRILGLPLYDIITVLSGIAVVIFRPWQKSVMSKRFGLVLGLLVVTVVGIGAVSSLVGSSLITYDLQIGAVLRVISSLLLFSSVYLLLYRSDYRVRLVVSSLIVIAFYQTAISVRHITSGLRYKGTFDDPNYFGVFLAAGLCILLSLVSGNQQKQRDRIFLFFLIGVLGISLFMTFSRGSYLAAFGGIAVVLWVRLRKTTKRFIVAFGLLACVIIMSIPYMQRLPGFQRFADRLDIVEAVRSGGTGRASIWRLAVFRIWENPLGYGWGSEPFVLNGMVSHNLLIEVAIQYGVLGAILVVLAFCTMIGGTLWMAYANDSDIDLGVAAAVITVFIGGVSLNMFSVRQFWFFLAIGAASVDNLRRRLTRTSLPKSKLLSSRCQKHDAVAESGFDGFPDALDA